MGLNFISHKAYTFLTSKAGKLLRKNYFICQTKLSCLFPVEVIVRLAKFSQFVDYHARRRKMPIYK